MLLTHLGAKQSIRRGGQLDEIHVDSTVLCWSGMTLTDAEPNGLYDIRSSIKNE